MSTEQDFHDVLDQQYPDVSYRYCVRVVYAIAGGRPVGTQFDIDDMAQETALRFRQYAAREVLADPKGALRRIARNVYSEAIRKRQRDRRLHDMLRLQQEIRELPFAFTSNSDPTPIKQEFLRRARVRLKSEDRHLLTLIYHPERRTVSEQAEYLGKSLRALTVQKNRLFRKLRYLRLEMSEEKLDGLMPFPTLRHPDHDTQDAYFELAASPAEKYERKLILSFWSTVHAMHCLQQPEQLQTEKSLTSFRDGVDLFLNNAMQWWPDRGVTTTCESDSYLQAIRDYTLARWALICRIDTKENRDMYIKLTVRCASRFRFYGFYDFANDLLHECGGLLRHSGWDHDAHSLIERALATNPFDDQTVDCKLPHFT